MFLDHVNKTFESIKLLSNISSVLQAEDQLPGIDKISAKSAETRYISSRHNIL